MIYFVDMDLLHHLITERPVLFARYVIYIVSLIIIIIMVIIKKYNRSRVGNHSAFPFLDSGAVNYDYDVLDELITKRYDNEEEAEALLQA